MGEVWSPNFTSQLGRTFLIKCCMFDRVVCGMSGFGDQKPVENKDRFGVLFSRAVLLASAAALDSPGQISLSVCE